MDCFVSFLIFSAVRAALVKLQTTLNTKNPTVTSGCQLFSTSIALLSPMEVTISMKNMSHQFLNYYYRVSHLRNSFFKGPKMSENQYVDKKKRW